MAPPEGPNPSPRMVTFNDSVIEKVAASHWFDGMGIPALAVDRKGVITGWNRRLSQISQLSSNDTLGGPFSDLLLQDDRGKWEKAFHDCLVAKQPSCSSCRMKIRSATNGTSLPPMSCQMQVTSLSTDDNKIIGAICFLEIYQEDYRKEISKEMERSLRRFLHTANVAAIAVDRSARICLWTERLACLSGYSREEALGTHLFETFIPSSAQNTFQDLLGKALAGDAAASSSEFVFQKKNGSTCFLRFNISPAMDEDGSIVGAVAVADDVTESTLHCRSLSERYRELQQMIDRANIAIFGIDSDGFVNEWNVRAADMTGYSRDEAFGKPFVETFLSPDHIEAFQTIQTNTLCGTDGTNVDLDFRAKHGETRHLLVTATTRRNVNNEISGAIYIAHDISEASKHDRAVAAMASELRQLIDTANAPIFGTDCDGYINEWNDKTAEITGYTKEEAFGCSLVDTFIVPFMQESVQDMLDNALEGRGTSNYALEFLNKANDVRHLLVNATTRRDAEGSVVGMVAVAQDVTESVQRDRAVAGMALELRQLIDTANAPVFGIDVDGNVNEWNRRIQEITGFSKEETFDEPLVEKFIAPHMQQKVKEILAGALRGNEPSSNELEFVSKSGEPRFLLVNATTRRDPEFKVVGVVGVAQDVTDDKRHAEELQRMQFIQATQEAKVETERNMTAYFAHELRNPLSAIDSALNAMPDNLPESAQSLVDGMKLCSSFMSTIMNNLLDVRKMEEGRMKLSTQPLSLKSLVRGVHKMLLPSVRSGVKFTVAEETNGRDWVVGDKHRLQQVLTNVITNAIKYTLNGSIAIKVGWEGDQVRFECADTGPGIPKSEQERLFQRFVQRGGAPGTGLGLAIAKHLVDLAGGTIRFYSDPSVKAGTTCVVLLPIQECESQEDISDQNNAAVKVIWEPLKFLIIDDVKVNRVMLKKRIQKGIAPKCSVREACTGEEALQICAAESFDVIIVDQFMEEAGGVMVGTDVVYAMRRMRIESVIVGCSGNDLEKEFGEAGADFVWKKPMPSNEQIISDIRGAFQKKNFFSSSL